MRVVEGPLPFLPNACLITGRNDGEFVDFEFDWIATCDPRVYLRTSVVEEAAKLLGMAPAAEVEAVKARQAELEARLAEQDRLLDAVNTLDEATAKAAGPDPAGRIGADAVTTENIVAG